MADFLESPRASKRRKTTTYGSNRSILKENLSRTSPTTERSGRRKLLEKENIQEEAINDSAYGSKEDSLIEDEISNVTNQEEISNGHEHRMGQGTPTKTRRSLSQATTTTNLSARGVSQRVTYAKATHDVETDKMDSAVLDRREHTSPLPNVESGGVAANVEHNEAIQPRSSGRQRKPTKRYTISPEKPKRPKTGNLKEDTEEQSKPRDESVMHTAPLRGILTPSGRKEKRSGPRKSVIFDQRDNNIEEQFGFRDIDNSVKKVSRKASSPKRIQDVENGKETFSSDSVVPGADIEAQQELEEDSFVEDFSGNSMQYDDSDPQEATVRELANIDCDPAVLDLKSQILARLVNVSVSPSSAPTELAHLHSQQQTLSALLKATITAGESNSLLLLGSRGAGKMKLLNHVLSRLSLDYPGNFHIVRLNGYFQTDDKLALKEIWKQLGRERELEEEETEGVAASSYADTMASLLSLLSHPDEFGTSNDIMDVDDPDERNYKTSKSIVFAIEEFDLFTTHPRQTLLYNLFDIAQSKKAPIAVIGCSTRMDVVECLEKRVKSRFSHRWLHVPNVKTLDGFEDSVKGVLCIETHTNVGMSEEEIKVRKQWNDYIQCSFLVSVETQRLIKQVFYTTKLLPELLTALYIPVATLTLPSSSSNTPGKSNIAAMSVATSVQSSSLILLPTIPMLHFSLLIAAARLDAIHNVAAVNFNLIYSHYVELIAQSKLRQTASGAVAVSAGLKLWGRETAKVVWEELGRWGLTVPVLSAGGTKDEGRDTQGGEGASVRMWRADVSLDDLVWALKKKWISGGNVMDVLVKWCQEV